MIWTHGDYLLTDETARVDVDALHAFLTHSYWAAGIPRETVARSLAHSLCFSAHQGGAQVAFARLITDRTTFANLVDVYVLPEHRGRGLARALLERIVGHPELQGLRRWTLATRDASGLYAKFGFTPLAAPGRFMERLHADVYGPKGT
jgi:GNAT superfamily N-acetyltransferase